MESHLAIGVFVDVLDESSAALKTAAAAIYQAFCEGVGSAYTVLGSFELLVHVLEDHDNEPDYC